MSFKQFLEKELLKAGYNNHFGRKNWEYQMGEDTFLNRLLKLFIEWEEMNSQAPQIPVE